MLTTQDRGKIEDIAKRYHVGRVLLFGSCIDDKAEGHDIDLAVEGLPPSRFPSSSGGASGRGVCRRVWWSTSG